MEKLEEAATRGHRLLQIAAVAVLSLATALAFGRVFTGPGTTLKLVGAAAASIALAGALERRGLLLASATTLLAMLLAVGLLVFPHTLVWHLLPGPRTVRAIARAVGRVGEQAERQVAPTVPLAPLMLASLTAVWTAAFATHALAVRAGSPLLACAPSAALLAFAGIVMEDGARPAYAGLFLVGVLALVFADGLRRVGQWGPVRPWPGPARRALAPKTTRGARTVAVAAVGLALLLPGMLPGFGSRSVLELGSGPIGGSGRVNPIVSVTASLKRQTPVELFEVASTRSAYWRWLSLDRFDGESWSSGDLYGESALGVSSGAQLPSQLAAAPSGRRGTFLQTVRVIEGGDPWLPMAYQPLSILTGASDLRYDPRSEMAVVDGGAPAGLQYTVRSILRQPKPAELDRLTKADFSSAPSEYTLLPENTPRAIFSIAHRIAARESTPFREIMAIQDHLRTFTYDDTISGRHDVKYLVNFLRRTKRGFCQQFATAMAVLVRALGYPARVGVGFTPGTYDPTRGVWRVTTANAHTWVEVLFPGYGWLQFEPTPTRDNPVADAYMAPAARERGACDQPAGLRRGPCGARGRARGAGGTAPADGPRAGNRPEDTPRLNGDEAHGKGTPSASPRSLRILVVTGLLALLLALALLIPIMKAARRRIALALAPGPREVVLAAYRVFSSRAGDLGLGRAPGETFEEYLRRIRSAVPSVDGDLETLTSAAGAAAYSPAAVPRATARAAVASGRHAIRDVRRGTPLARRTWGLWRVSR